MIYLYDGLILTVIVQLKLTGSINLSEITLLTHILAYLLLILIEKPFIQLINKTIQLRLDLNAD